jgi:hypothetical protein
MGRREACPLQGPHDGRHGSRSYHCNRKVGRRPRAPRLAREEDPYPGGWGSPGRDVGGHHLHPVSLPDPRIGPFRRGGISRGLLPSPDWGRLVERQAWSAWTCLDSYVVLDDDWERTVEIAERGMYCHRRFYPSIHPGQPGQYPPTLAITRPSGTDHAGGGGSRDGARPDGTIGEAGSGERRPA